MTASEQLVTDFFTRHQVAGFLLPGGWFGGRPMDSLHRLNCVTERPKRLMIELDDQLLLSFSPGYRLYLSVSSLAMAYGTEALVVSDFGQCNFEFVEYGNDTPHQETYTDGTVQFIAPT